MDLEANKRTLIDQSSFSSEKASGPSLMSSCQQCLGMCDCRQHVEVPFRSLEQQAPTAGVPKRSLAFPEKWKSISTSCFPEVKENRQHTKHQSHDQNNSIFLTKPPLEIRHLVYKHYFRHNNPGLTIRILTRKDKLVHVCGRLRNRDARPEKTHAVLCDNHCKEGFLPLLLTCRKMYAEAVPLLYTLPTFLFHDPETLTRLSTTTPLLHLHSIQSVYLDWAPSWSPLVRWRNLFEEEEDWAAMWRVISSMKSLMELRVGLRDRYLRGLEAREQTLRPLLEMRGRLRVFEVVLGADVRSWGLDGGGERGFTVVEEFSD